MIMRRVLIKDPRVSHLRIIMFTQFCEVHFSLNARFRTIVCKELLTFTDWIIVAPCAIHNELLEELGVEAISYEKFIRLPLREENYIFLHHASHFKHSDSRRSMMLEVLKAITTKRIVLM